MIRKSTIVVVDDGVCKDWCNIKALDDDLEIDSKRNFKPYVDSKPCHISHGSVCASIIARYAEDASILSLKILDDKTHTCNIVQLVDALYWCLNNNAKFVNLSLGTYDYYDYLLLRPVITQLSCSGCRIVAAYGIDINSLPASLPGVFGVKAMRSFQENQYRVNDMAMGAMLLASSSHKMPDNSISKFANSYSAPVVTAMLYEKYRKQPELTLQDILYMEGTASEYMKQYLFRSRIDFVYKAIVLVDDDNLFADKLFFEVDHWYSNRDQFAEIHFQEKESLVIIPPTMVDNTYIDKIQNIISQNENNIYGIVYAGTPDESIKNVLANAKNAYVWYEHPNFIHQLNEPAKDLAFVQLDTYGCMSACIDLVRELQKDYNILVASDLKYGYLYGFEYLDPNVDITKQIFYYQRRYRYDAIFIVSDTLNITYEYRIVIQEANEKECSSSSTQLVIPACKITTNVSECANMVLEYLSGE